MATDERPAPPEDWRRDRLGRWRGWVVCAACDGPAVPGAIRCGGCAAAAEANTPEASTGAGKEATKW